ncbi:phosphoenolpyruvate carboxylase [Kiloniella laminariae]|uniref:phosphoenolpyruvate carboxylase n=1 Tax=Kiloniella laminariae TaxID=454162 RepID=UPI0003606981|nr:phosphoenolpyruvate carboxylase [Kiloniella laminariae]
MAKLDVLDGRALDELRNRLKGEDRFSPARALRDDLETRLVAMRQDTVKHPLDNPVLELAHDLSEKLSAGQISIANLQELIQLLSAEAFADRAERVGQYINLADQDENRTRLASLFKSLACQDEDNLVSFGEFSRRVEREAFGIVITAHPTFGLSQEHYQALAQFAADETLGGQALEASDLERLSKLVIEQSHEPDQQINLLAEHGQAQKAIESIQQAMREVYDVVLSVAAELYPENWTELTPRVLTIASWVGYDLDGRTDITWADTLHTRMKVQVAQLKYYVAALNTISGALDNDHDELATTLALVKSRVTLALHVAEKETDFFSSEYATGDELSEVSRRIVEDDGSRLVHTVELIEALNRSVALTNDLAVKRALIILRSEVANYGLATSHMHVRLNAAQLHNAVRKSIAMEGEPDDPGRRRGNFRALSGLLDDVKPLKINFGSLAAENTTAKRMFMLIAQIIKYVDASAPIRFLIAECDTPFTILTALYYARLFGVDDVLDISPLFETGTALERGSEVIAELLENEHYRAYVQKRGRLCIQTGFSDAGRYLGQVSASLAIERLHMKLARLMADQKLSGVEVVIFDTHGESIGRGAHPVSFADRLKYVSSPMTRSLFAKNQIPLKHEVSFQGGDGYLYFGTPKLAMTTLTRLLEHALGKPEADDDDAFYTNTDYSLDFFLSLKSFHETTLENRDYAALLGSFSTNLLYQTGSRKSKRQHEKHHGIDRGHPSQIRAIPHNAILQQLGYLANTAGGFGTAISRDLDAFVKLHGESDRVRRFMDMVSYAKGLSSLNTPEAYAALFNPRYWLAKAYAVKHTLRSEDQLRLSELVADTGRYDGMSRMLQSFRRDAISLHRGLDALSADGQEKVFPFDTRRRINLIILHVVRLCLIQEIFLLAMRIPPFATRNDLTLDDLIQDILAMEIPAAIAELKATFPVYQTQTHFDEGDYGEPSEYRDNENRDYSKEHRSIFGPIEELYDLCRRISVAVSNSIGAHG